jgi:hypothetical protein
MCSLAPAVIASVSIDREFWRGFIQIYGSLPALWKVRSDLYKNRNLKRELLQISSLIEGN